MKESNLSIESGGRFVTINLDGEVYGLPIEIVEGIVPWEPMTHIPRMPKFLAGVVTIRGSVLAVIDLRKRLGLRDEEHTAANRIVILQNDETSVGFIVDSVKEVTWIPNNVVERHTVLVNEGDEEFLDGVAKLDDSLVILLNIGRLLSQKECKDVTRVQAKAAAAKVA